MEEEELKASCLEGHGHSRSGIIINHLKELSQEHCEGGVCSLVLQMAAIYSQRVQSASQFLAVGLSLLGVRLDADLSTWKSHANSQCNILQYVKPQHVIFPKTAPLLVVLESSLFLHDTYNQASSFVTQTFNMLLEAVVCSCMLPLALLRASSLLCSYFSPFRI